MIRVSAGYCLLDEFLVGGLSAGELGDAAGPRLVAHAARLLHALTHHHHVLSLHPLVCHLGNL